MTISILTLFPEMFAGPFDHSIIRRAKDKNIVHINFVNIRDFSSDTYKTVDDHPYGGGVGMIMRVDVVNRALEHMKALCKRTSCKTILLDPQGTPYTQAKAKELSSIDHLILICGHYEGVDERVRSLVDETISIGDFIVTGGEIPAMVLIDSVVRLLPGVLKKDTATLDESFTQPLLEYPQYTRPKEFNGMAVPNVLLSGNHAAIDKWKKIQQLANTKNRRPDLLKIKSFTEFTPYSLLLRSKRITRRRQSS
ncbi:MAG: tRNA (guanosine(37)-N1)-methyltransferase TrmD [Patescibacteria group bacterium]